MPVGLIETLNPPFADLPPQADGSRIPPRGRTAIGAGGSGGNGDIPPAFRKAFDGAGDWKNIPTDQELDVALYRAFDEEITRQWTDPNTQPWLLKELDKLGVTEMVYRADPAYQVSQRQLDRFMKQVRAERLIKRQPLTLRQYIGIINPFKRKRDRRF